MQAVRIVQVLLLGMQRALLCMDAYLSQYTYFSQIFFQKQLRTNPDLSLIWGFVMQVLLLGMQRALLCMDTYSYQLVQCHFFQGGGLPSATLARCMRARGSQAWGFYAWDGTVPVLPGKGST